jgi:predicted phage terminase large subunit-like protein
MVRVKARAELAKRELARRHLHNFTDYTIPWFINTTHHRFIGGCLEKAINREPGWTRLIFHAPPQHGKSLFCSCIFPAWYRGRFPDDLIILTSYGDEHATGLSSKAKGFVELPEYKRLFPSVQLSKTSRAEGHWELTAPHRGEFHATGIRGAITGKGANLLVIDDPYKNREEAESKLVRERTIEGWRSTLSTRLHHNAIVIVMATRWREDDLSGWLLKNADPPFRYIKLAALAQAGDPMGRRLMGPLWPARFPQPMLLAQMKSIGTYDWFSMYQGDPHPPEGSLFKRNYFQRVPAAPSTLKWVRFWDLATSTNEKNDATSSIQAALDINGNVFLRRRIKGRWEWPDVRTKIIATSKAERDEVMRVGIEAQGTQKGMVQECWRDPDLINIGILGVPVPNDKRIRALSAATRGEIGKLYVVDGDWVDDYIEEMIGFGSIEHDDDVDATSGCFHLLAMETGGID